MNTDTIRISNLPLTHREDLRTLMSHIKTLIEKNGGILTGVDSIYIPVRDGTSQGYGFVKLESPENVTRLLNTIKSPMINGREVFIERASSRGGRTKRRVYKRRKNRTRKRSRI